MHNAYSILIRSPALAATGSAGVLPVPVTLSAYVQSNNPMQPMQPRPRWKTGRVRCEALQTSLSDPQLILQEMPVTTHN